eukprot:scaffold3857_cov127-Cylindrotheca_fusiformis.AAC.3
MSLKNDGAANGSSKRRRKRRWGDSDASTSAPAVVPSATNAAAAGAIDSKDKALALQASIKERLEALKAKTGAIAGLKRPPPTVKEEQQPPKAKRAKVYDIDMSVTGPTFREKPGSKKPKVNPYLAHTLNEENEESEEPEAFVDERLAPRRERKRHKEINFIEPGKFIEIAERKRTKALNAEESGFVSGRKAGMYVQSRNMANIYGSTEVMDDDDSRVAPRAEANEKTVMPFVVEWWDLELLPGSLKKQVGAYEGKAISKAAQSQMQQLESSSGKGSGVTANLVNPEVEELRNQCFNQAMLSYSKTAALIQHIVPIKPQNAKEGPGVEPTLYLTKKERKRQRKLRRQEKQRELQDLQAAGLMPPPEPRLTLKNFIRVLGDQAFVDPSQMEQKVMQQVQARQRAHLERNEAQKLTKEQRSAKLAKKYKEDTSGGLHVALFYVKDMSHPYHRTKVDLNAQQLNITGGVVECQVPQLSCIICEGGPKAIKKYTRLMLVRMKWKGPDNAEEEVEEEEDEDGVKRHKFNPENKCELVWTGMASKRFFKGFVFQACESSEQASKILRAKGVGHFWNQVLTHASGRGETFQLKLADTDDEEEEDADDDIPSGEERGEDTKMGEA